MKKRLAEAQIKTGNTKKKKAAYLAEMEKAQGIDWEKKIKAEAEERKKAREEAKAKREEAKRREEEERRQLAIKAEQERQNKSVEQGTTNLTPEQQVKRVQKEPSDDFLTRRDGANLSTSLEARRLANVQRAKLKDAQEKQSPEYLARVDHLTNTARIEQVQSLLAQIAQEQDADKMSILTQQLADTLRQGKLYTKDHPMHDTMTQILPPETIRALEQGDLSTVFGSKNPDEIRQKASEWTRGIAAQAKSLNSAQELGSAASQIIKLNNGAEVARSHLFRRGQLTSTQTKDLVNSPSLKQTKKKLRDIGDWKKQQVTVFGNASTDTIVLETMRKFTENKRSKHEYSFSGDYDTFIDELLDTEQLKKKTEVSKELNAKINSAVKKALDEKKLKDIKPQKEGNRSEYKHSTGTLTQRKTKEGKFIFTPGDGFSGVVRVPRLINGKPDANQVDIVEYEDGKAIAVSKASEGTCRIAGIGALEKEIRRSTKEVDPGITVAGSHTPSNTPINSHPPRQGQGKRQIRH